MHLVRERVSALQYRASELPKTSSYRKLSGAGWETHERRLDRVDPGGRTDVHTDRQTDYAV